MNYKITEKQLEIILDITTDTDLFISTAIGKHIESLDKVLTSPHPMTLREQFEKATGLSYKWINHKHEDVTLDGTSYRKDEYIKWLETKLHPKVEPEECEHTYQRISGTGINSYTQCPKCGKRKY